METALYYGFSTIAQTVAGALALTGAFGLYKLQALANEMEAPSSLLVNNFHIDALGASILQQALLGKKFEMLLAHFSTGRFQSVVEANGKALAARTELGRMVASKTSMIVDLKRAALLTVGLIVYSVAVLFVVPYLSVVAWLVWSAIGIGIVWLLACLVSYLVVLGVILD